MTAGGLLWSLALSGVLIGAVGVMVVRLLARGSAAMRHHVLATVMLVLVLVPIGLGARLVWPEPRADAMVWVQDPAAAVSAQTIPSFVTDGAGRARVLAAIWLVPTVLLLARLVVGLLTVGWLRRTGRPVRGGDWERDLAFASRRLGLRHAPELRETAAIGSPLVTGLLRHAILLPHPRAGETVEGRRAVLIHECAHIARRDVLLQSIAQIACALHWFNPLVWLAAYRLLHESECACDDLVLAGGVRPSVYIRKLLAELDARPLSALLPMAGLGSSGLMTRMEAIGDGRRARGTVSRRGRTAMLVGALGLVVALVVFAPTRAPGGAEPTFVFAGVEGADSRFEIRELRF